MGILFKKLVADCLVTESSLGREREREKEERWKKGERAETSVYFTWSWAFSSPSTHNITGFRENKPLREMPRLTL